MSYQNRRLVKNLAASALALTGGLLLSATVFLYTTPDKERSLSEDDREADLQYGLDPRGRGRGHPLSPQKPHSPSLDSAQGQGSFPLKAELSWVRDSTKPDADSERGVDAPPAGLQSEEALTAGGSGIEIKVMAPGTIHFSEEQLNILRGSSGGWGGRSPEAKAIIDAIPPEAFSSEW